jgi:predicted adenylyl cyclase CyaB
MPRNLELKARLRSAAQAASVARRLGARDAGMLEQTDIYYQVPSGRLKLRIIGGKAPELIAYERPDNRGGRYSEYLVLPVADPRLTDRLFRRLVGLKLAVRKNRRLFMYKNARIHIDAVRGLGAFIEFEVMVTRGTRQARRLFETLVKEFGIRRADTVAGSYSDLLTAKRKRRR